MSRGDPCISQQADDHLASHIKKTSPNDQSIAAMKPTEKSRNDPGQGSRLGLLRKMKNVDGLDDGNFRSTDDDDLSLGAVIEKDRLIPKRKLHEAFVDHHENSFDAKQQKCNRGTAGSALANDHACNSARGLPAGLRTITDAGDLVQQEEAVVSPQFPSQGMGWSDLINSVGRGLSNLSGPPIGAPAPNTSGAADLQGAINLLQGSHNESNGINRLSSPDAELFRRSVGQSDQNSSLGLLLGQAGGGMQASDLLFNSDLATLLRRNHALQDMVHSNPSSASRLMGSNQLHDSIDSATATALLLRSNGLAPSAPSPADLQASPASLNPLLFGGGAPSQASQLLGASGVDLLLLRRAAELGLAPGGGRQGGGAAQQSMANQQLLASLLLQGTGTNPQHQSFGAPGAVPGNLQGSGFGLPGWGHAPQQAPSPATIANVLLQNSLAPSRGSSNGLSSSWNSDADGAPPSGSLQAPYQGNVFGGRSRQFPPSAQGVLPPQLDGPLPHFTQRVCVPMSTDEDENWLSEFLCFVRSDLVELFRASDDDVTSRINSKKVSFCQLGIRCRYCAHMPHGDRASRSSSFPSSIDRIYQSLTMMIRDHFGRCPCLPTHLKARFDELKSRTTQGATDSKRYWIESAKRLGMVDTPNQGILVTEATQCAATTASRAVSIRHGRSDPSSGLTRAPCLIVDTSDKPLVSGYIYFLLSQVEKVSLTESERVGNRKSMELGMPGFGCKYCCAVGRKGLCRFFPARRRTLPGKIKDLSDHLRRCTLCPSEIKQELVNFKKGEDDVEPSEESNKHFFDRVWARLHSNRGRKSC